MCFLVLMDSQIMSNSLYRNAGEKAELGAGTKPPTKFRKRLLNKLAGSWQIVCSIHIRKRTNMTLYVEFMDEITIE